MILVDMEAQEGKFVAISQPTQSKKREKTYLFVQFSALENCFTFIILSGRPSKNSPPPSREIRVPIQGDSGGPLTITPNSKSHTLIGILSQHFGSCSQQVGSYWLPNLCIDRV